MQGKNKITLGIFIALCLCSCTFVREKNILIYDEMDKDEVLTVQLLQLDYEEEQLEQYDYGEALAQLIFGMSEEEVNPSTKTWYYEENGSSFTFGTREYGKSNNYHSAFRWDLLSDFQYRRLYPNDSLDTCTKEEAIAFCAPYASALGLDGDELTVETYALTLDLLSSRKVSNGAPYESYEYYMSEEMQAKKDAGLEEEAMEMLKSNYASSVKEEHPWEKKHEAIIVVYRMQIDGVELNDATQMATMIYVPYYDEIVYAQGYLPMAKKQVIGEGVLMTKSEAVSMITLQGSVKGEVQDVVLTYMLEKQAEDTSERKVVPAWRVDYTQGNIKYSKWVEAVCSSVEEEVITANVLRLDYSDEILAKYDYTEILSQLVFGMSKEETLTYKMSGGTYENEKVEFTAGGYKEEKFDIKIHESKKNLAYSLAYQTTSKVSEISDNQWRLTFPEEELATCSKEEAIAKCEPYATALGIIGENITIETYAMTLEQLQNSEYGAPDETFVYPLLKELKLEEKLESGEITQEEYMTQFTEYVGIVMNITNKKDFPWEEKHEAIIVTYYMSVNGMDIDDNNYKTIMIYVPYYDEVVVASGSLPFDTMEVVSEETLISKKEASAIAKEEVGEIEVNDVVLVYKIKPVDEFDSTRADNYAYPAWRVDYTIGNTQNSIWIHAVDGSVFSY